MKKRTLLLLSIAGIIGYIAAFAIARRTSPATAWRSRIDRAAAISRAHAVARSVLGIDTRDWFAEAGAEVDRTRSEVVERFGQPPDRPIPLVETYVILHDPSGNQSVGVRFEAGGSPTAIVHRAATNASSAVAAAALRRIVPDLERFHLTASERQPDGSMRYRWERPSVRDGITFVAESVVRGSRIVEVRVGPELADALVQRVRRPFSWRLAGVLKYVVLLVFAYGWFIRSSIRREVAWRPAIVLAVVLFALMAATDLNLSRVAEEAFDDATRALSAGPLREILATQWDELLLDFFAAINLAILWGASGERRRWAGADIFEHLLRGKLRRHAGPIATAVAAGFAAGGLASASRAMVSLFGALPDLPNPTVLVSPRVAVVTALTADTVSLFLAFAFFATLCYTRFGTRGAGRLASIGVGILVFFAPDSPNLFTALAAAAAWVVIAEALFREVGFLGVLTASAATSLATVAYTAMLQPAAAIRTSGMAIAGGFALAGAFAIAIALRAKQREVRALPARIAPRADRATRERMDAELEIARQAQAKMLPRAMPEIPGFAISALCRPALQVGGDLYDFVPLADGRWAIAVADVSGKGIGAALYMTMTKGLLLGACEEQRDPAAIASAINRELYAFGNRNVFVTMFLGILDPAQRRLDWVRAGHNASLLYRAAGGETTFLKPRGIALGMSSERVFARVLETSTLTFAPGDSLYIYSDGVTEAMNTATEEYGDARLVIAAKQAAETPGPIQARDHVVGDVETFVGTAAQWDDLTLMVLRAE